MEWPRISIVTPTKNADLYLEETIKSVIEQDYPNFEYIVIDGCSTDGTLEIVRKYESYLAYWESSPDGTLYEAVAKGFKRASGEILGWINADDIYEAGAFEKVAGHFMNHPGHQVVYFEDTVEKDGWRVPNRPQPERIGLGEFLCGHIIYQDGTFFKRSAYERIGGLDISLKYAGDFDLWLRFSEKYPLYKCAGHASCFRVRPGQLSIGNWDKYLEEVEECKIRFSKRLPVVRKKKALLSAKLRNGVTRLRTKLRKRYWPIANEGSRWFPVIHNADYSVRDCRCPVCSENPHRLLFSTPDTRFGDRKIWRVYECCNCRLTFTFPRPDDSTLRALYERSYSGDIKGCCPPTKGYYSPYQCRSIYHYQTILRLKRLFPFLHQRRWLLHDDIVPIQEPHDAAILDIGCFEGRILEHLRNKGYSNLYGVELNRKAAEVARSKGFSVSTEDITRSKWPNKPVDAIILNQVLEHVGDPIGFLKSVCRLLSEKGSLYLSIPNYRSAFVDYYGPAWAHWHIPYHFLTVSPHTLKIIAEKTGFKIKWLRTNTPIHYAYMSDALGRFGLGGVVSHNIDPDAPGFRREWENAKGVTVFSRLFLDPFLRGDCLYARLVRNTP